MSHVVETELRSQAERARKVDLALSVAVALAQMDPRGIDDLASHLKALNEAREINDQEGMTYALNGIREVFYPEVEAGEPDIDSWFDSVAAASPEVQRARNERNDENARFMRRYQELKAAAGLQTQRQVADACELSINTVNAIETQSVKPQTRTVQKLAKGFGVSIETLLSA